MCLGGQRLPNSNWKKCSFQALISGDLGVGGVWGEGERVFSNLNKDEHFLILWVVSYQNVERMYQ